MATRRVWRSVSCRNCYEGGAASYCSLSNALRALEPGETLSRQDGMFRRHSGARSDQREPAVRGGCRDKVWLRSFSTPPSQQTRADICVHRYIKLTSTALSSSPLLIECLIPYGPRETPPECQSYRLYISSRRPARLWACSKGKQGAVPVSGTGQL